MLSDYSKMYYFIDGCLIVCILLLVFKVDFSKKSPDPDSSDNSQNRDCHVELTDIVPETANPTTANDNDNDNHVHHQEVKDINIFQAIGKIISWPMVIFALGVFNTGFLWGIHDTFQHIYLQRELGASSQLISYCTLAGRS